MLTREVSARVPPQPPAPAGPVVRRPRLCPGHSEQRTDGMRKSKVSLWRRSLYPQPSPWGWQLSLRQDTAGLSFLRRASPGPSHMVSTRRTRGLEDPCVDTGGSCLCSLSFFWPCADVKERRAAPHKSPPHTAARHPDRGISHPEQHWFYNILLPGASDVAEI